jgi:hypothetical protein
VKVSDWQATLNKLAAKGMPSQPMIAVEVIVGVDTYTAAAKVLG